MVRKASIAVRHAKRVNDYVVRNGVYYANHLERSNHLHAKRRRREAKEAEYRPPKSYPKSDWKGAYDVMTIAREQADLNDLNSTLARVDAIQRESSDDALFIYISLLQKCVESGKAAEGDRILANMAKNGHVVDRVIAHLIMEINVRAGKSARVMEMFNQIFNKNTHSYSLMITAFAQDGHYRAALDLFRGMEVKADPHVLATALYACASLKSVEEGRKIHKQIKKDSNIGSELVLDNNLLNMYCKCGDFGSARDVFSSMAARNSTSWNVLVMGYVEGGQNEEALKLFRRMLHEPDPPRPSSSTFAAVLRTCATLKRLEDGREFHKSAVEQHGMGDDVAVTAEAVKLYTECGQIAEARSVFEGVRSKGTDVWNRMLAAYSSKGDDDAVLELFERMQAEGVRPDASTFGILLESAVSLEQGRALHRQIETASVLSTELLRDALLRMYSRFPGGAAEAELVFGSMPEPVSASALAAMMNAYVASARPSDAVALFKRMGDVAADADVLVAALTACGEAVDLESGKEVDSVVSRSECREEIRVQNAVMAMYAACGQLQYARWEFDRMMGQRNLVTWNTLLAAYTVDRRADWRQSVDRCLGLLPSMQQEGVEPDATTFGAMMTACLRAGRLELARDMLLTMLRDHQLEADSVHYTCLAELLTQSGRLDEADELRQCWK